jgi:hypothetical protein
LGSGEIERRASNIDVTQVRLHPHVPVAAHLSQYTLYHGTFQSEATSVTPSRLIIRFGVA